MIEEQKRKAKVLRFTSALRAAGASNVTVSYSGDGDEGRAESPEIQDAAGNPLEASRLPAKLDLRKLGDLLEGFAPQGYEDGDGGHGTVSFDVQTLIIRVEHHWYETVSHPDQPREI